MKVLMSGNEAIARGVWEAGVRHATGYPGTPSTEILENLLKYEDIEAEWSTNEKVALDVAMGVSLADFDARRDPEFWNGLMEVVPAWDRMIGEFNSAAS